MAVVSDSAFLVRLPSGGQAVYSLRPEQVSAPDMTGPAGSPTTLSERSICHGVQVAHEKDGRWYKPGGWDEITDLRTIALLERAPNADEQVTA